MSALAKAMQVLGIDQLKAYIETWTTTYATLYDRPELSADERQTLLADYLIWRLQELVQG